MDLVRNFHGISFELIKKIAFEGVDVLQQGT
jgi:hypothetical protein